MAHFRFTTLGLSLLILAVAFTGQRSVAADEDSPALVYQTPAGVAMRVTAAGLSEIRTPQSVLARGGWSVFNAESWFKNAGTGQVDAGKIVEKSIELLGPRHARVRQVKKDVVSTTDYTFDGEDVLVSARVENNHPDQPMNVVGFSGLEFCFDRPPAGLMLTQHISYFMAHGVGLCHPSHWARIGGSYATDDAIGVGLSPWRTGWNRTLLLWDYADWNPGKRELLPQRRLLYFVVAPVPPRGSRTFDMKLRVSPNRDWKHLLAPYREHFQQTFGPVCYKADYRWIATDYLNHSQKAVSATNPYGFHGGARRFDRPEGIAAFCDQAIPALKGAGGQGVILWGQGGDDPRGGMYRPDFDVLPPEVEAQWPALAERFHAAGLKLGVCTRPADMAVRLDWKTDQIITLNADDPGHRAMLLRRFQNMKKMGCTLFYLDSFGADLEHVKLMRFLREQLGPDVLTFVEHQCDAILPYSGGYSETTFHAANSGQPPQYRIWSGLDQWEIYQWLTPGAQLASRLYQTEGKIPEGFESVDAFFYRNRVTPLLPTGDFLRAAGIEKIQSRCLDAGGAWKQE